MYERIFLSKNRSPGILASSVIDIVFLNGVVRLNVGMVPEAVSLDANSLSISEDLSDPLSLITLSSASNHS